jgi:hypothetical protein
MNTEWNASKELFQNFMNYAQHFNTGNLSTEPSRSICFLKTYWENYDCYKKDILESSTLHVTLDNKFSSDPSWQRYYNSYIKLRTSNQ